MWYLPENARGVGTASDQFRRTAGTAPAGQADYCAYVEVYGKYFDAGEPEGSQSSVTAYRLYLGSDNRADYNLLRNRVYTANITLRSRNEADTWIDCVPNPADRVEITPLVNVSYGVVPSVGAQSADKAQSGCGAGPAGTLPGTKAPVDGSAALNFYFVRADALSGTFGAYGTTALKATRAAGTGTTALTFSPVQYYLPDGRKTKMVGWYPQADSFVGGVVSWTFNGTQDIMTAAPQEGSKNAAMPAFAFNHKTAQLQFFLYAEDTKAQAVWGKVKSVAVTAQRNACTFTVASAESTGSVVFTGDADKTFTVAGAAEALPVVGRGNAVQFGQAMMIEPQDDGYLLHVTVVTELKGTVTATVSAQAYPVGSVTRLMLKFPNGDVTVEPAISVNGWTGSNQEVEAGGTYPYAVAGRYIVSRDLFGSSGGPFHENWKAADMPVHNDDDDIAKTVSSRFEVASADLSGTMLWGKTRAGCAAYNQTGTSVGDWRVPTLQEVRLIYAQRSSLSGVAGFPNTSFYWTATNNVDMSGACVINFKNGNTGYGIAGSNYVRCVRDF